MRTQFFSRNLCIGVLIACVLVLGVQEVTDAVSVSVDTNIPDSPTGSSTVEVQVEQSFEITFTFTLNGRTLIQHPMGGYATQAVIATSALNANRVDAEGYPAERISGTLTDYRKLHTTASTYISSEAPTGYTATLYRLLQSGTEYTTNGATASLSDSSGNVYNSQGNLLYYYVPDNPNTVNINEEKGAIGAKVLAAHWTPKVSDPQRYYYDEEQITITHDAGLELKLKSNSFLITQATIFKERLTGAHASAIDLTTSADATSASITLICKVLEDNDNNPDTLPTSSRAITITNSTADTDYPPGHVARVNQNQSEQIGKLTVLVKGAPSLDDGTLPTTKSIERIDALFGRLLTSDFPPGGQNTIVYQIVTGNGSLYTEANPISKTTLQAHQDLQVYINMNRTTNLVSAYILGSPDTRKIIEFKYIGSDRREPTTTPATPATPATPQTNTITVTPSSISGRASTTQALTVSAGAAAVRVQGDALIAAGGRITGSGAAWSITLPDTPGSTYSLTISASGYVDRIITVTVTGSTRPGTLSITSVGARAGTRQQVRVTVRDSDGAFHSEDLTVILAGAVDRSTIPTTNGTGSVIVTLPTATGAHTLTVSATGYTQSSVTIPAVGQQQQQQQQEEPVQEPDSIEISGPATRTGTINEALNAPLLVRVLDDDGNGIEDARVTFRVRTGRGRLSQRGTGRAVALQTDRQGYARAPFTPLSTGTITVEASVRELRNPVTFTITTGGTPTTPTTTSNTGTDPTPSTTISPVVHINAANRPPMLWVDSGGIYALVGANVQRFAPSVDNALNIAVGGGKVYWTEQTGESSGTINSANLNGSNVKELTEIMAVPMGIAVDTENLYWTNSRGRIQSANLDGSGIRNVMQNLSNPVDIALAGGNAYWTEATGSVRFVNLRGQKQVRNISTGTNTPGSLAIGGGKVYWTERTGDSGGTVNSANLNGSGAKQLASILATPIGIAVDNSRSKLYWTNARGRIQSANLDGSGIRNVADGLGSPGDIVISNSIAAPTATTSTTTSASAANKYDINGDGTVDSTDVDTLLLAVLAELTDAKYDVNGDGAVDAKDIRAVNNNLDTGTASAPTLLGRKFSAMQIDRLQEQIDLLIATDDRSPAAMKTLIYLQQLIALARPEKTQLLANYPNPFNPETWIPYELATDTDVRITIYNTQGVVIRTLELGHQSAGYYTGRERAAYWDGRNALGEQVASGIYFYQFETGDMSSMRKMVILK